ncbi:MAG: 16S rRNA (uracil(1498)-N(3))-methyltransferase, partial [Opitutaceae bacterium]
RGAKHGELSPRLPVVKLAHRPRVNLVLFEADEIGRPLPRSDRRARHVLDVLRRGEGEAFDAGVINGPRGRARLATVAADSVTFAFEPTHPPDPPPAITLLAGLPRPQTARDILRDATTLGVAALHFVVTEKTEPGYTRSTLWTSGEWRRHAIAGAEQAFDTLLPEVTWGRPLAEVAALSGAGDELSALDNYESPAPLGAALLAPGRPVVLAVGGEHGWSAADRATLRAAGFAFHHLGRRVLRAESAVVAALAITRARLGLM